MKNIEFDTSGFLPEAWKFIKNAVLVIITIFCFAGMIVLTDTGDRTVNPETPNSRQLYEITVTYNDLNHIYYCSRYEVGFNRITMYDYKNKMTDDFIITSSMVVHASKNDNYNQQSIDLELQQEYVDKIDAKKLRESLEEEDLIEE